MTLQASGSFWASFNLREDQLDDLHIGSPVELMPADSSARVAARIAEIVPRGEFAPGAPPAPSATMTSAPSSFAPIR